MRRNGRWIATNPGAAVSGYHISLLIAPWINAAEIIEDSEGDQEYFYNFVLGEPYNPGDVRVTRSTILDCWTPKDLTTERYFLGVDVGNIKHYVLGSQKGVIKVGIFTEWYELDDLLKFYKPTMVIDAMPDNTMSRYYVNNYTRAYMCFLNRDKQVGRVLRWGSKLDEIGVIHADRNRIIDLTINEILNARILFGLPSDRSLATYIKHWETLRRVKVVDNIGIERYVWESTTNVDHFAFATVFYYIATLTEGAGMVFGDTPKPIPLVKETMDGPVGNLGEILEQQERELL